MENINVIDLGVKATNRVNRQFSVSDNDSLCSVCMTGICALSANRSKIIDKVDTFDINGMSGVIQRIAIDCGITNRYHDAVLTVWYGNFPCAFGGRTRKNAGNIIGLHVHQCFEALIDLNCVTSTTIAGTTCSAK